MADCWRLAEAGPKMAPTRISFVEALRLMRDEWAWLLESGAEDTAEGALECTDGAVSDDRGKLRGKAAVSVQRAIDLLDTGDLDGARNVLADLLGWP